MCQCAFVSIHHASAVFVTQFAHTPCRRRRFVALFANSLPVETTLRVWDAFLLEGSKVLHRIGLAILRIAEPKLLQCRDQQEILCTLQQEQAGCLDCERLISFAFDRHSFLRSFPRSRINALRRKHRARLLLSEQADFGHLHGMAKSNSQKSDVERGASDGMARLVNAVHQDDEYLRSKAVLPPSCLQRMPGVVTTHADVSSSDEEDVEGCSQLDDTCVLHAYALSLPCSCIHVRSYPEPGVPFRVAGLTQCRRKLAHRRNRIGR